MSDTPITDKEWVRFSRLMVEFPESGGFKTTELVPADFARQLERDRARLIEALRAVVDCCRADFHGRTDWTGSMRAPNPVQDGPKFAAAEALLAEMDK